MKAAIISITGSCALGARYIVSALREGGHDVDMVHFKLFRTKMVERSDQETIDNLYQIDKKRGIDSVFRYTYMGNEYLPNPEHTTQKEIDIFLDLVEKRQYGVIGFSLYAPNIPTAARLSKAIKEKHPHIKIVWAGIQPTLSPEESLQYVDIICRGEGEHTMNAFLNNPERTDIKGFWIRKDGELIKNPLPELIQDLDSLPFPSYGIQEYVIDEDRMCQDLMDNPDFYRDCYTIISSRGCPYRCAYCVHSKMYKIYPKQKYLRRRSVDNFIAELKEITSRFNFNKTPINFYDEIFAWDIEWVREFAEKYKKEVNLPFLCYSHVKFSNREIMLELRDAGLVAPCIGIQSGSDYMLKEIYNRQPVTIQEYNDYAEMLFELGYKIYETDVMIGSAFERKEDLDITLNLLSNLKKPYTLHLIHIVSYPNTTMADIPEEKKTHLTEHDFYFWGMLYTLAQFKEISIDTLNILKKDKKLQQHPEILDEIMQGIYRLYPEVLQLWGFSNEGKSYAGIGYQYFVPEARKELLRDKSFKGRALRKASRVLHKIADKITHIKS